MVIAPSPPSVMARRHAAIAAFVGEIPGLVERHGESPALLDAIKPRLIALAAQRELFPADQFPLRGPATYTLYELSVGAGGSPALHALVSAPAGLQPPHDHTTWAVIAGVVGDEHNVFYRRTDMPRRADAARLERTGETHVRPGNACAMAGDVVHTVEITSPEGALHLHLYGLSFDRLTQRVVFESTAGGATRRFLAHPDFHTPLVSADTLAAMLDDGEEIAVLDVREGGTYARSHLFLAASLPLSLLELRVPDLLPNPRVRVVVIDDDVERAKLAAHRLRRGGYGNIAVLDGGNAAWVASGRRLFSGVYVPSKAFGELVEHAKATPRLTAAELKRRLDARDDILMVDSRPLSEFRDFSLPGAVDCPGAELVHRVPAAAPSPATTVVVNCAGRTRSIIGAQSLINAGVPNPVMALENGTMGWHLIGLPLAHKATAALPAPAAAAKEDARRRAAALAQRHGISTIDHATLAQWRRDPAATTYLFDVRLPEDYAGGHLPDAINAPGGQLVQSTDAYAPVRHARIVLVDDDMIQAPMTAHWLRQMGWSVHILAPGGERIAGERPRAALGDLPKVGSIGPAELRAALAEERVVAIDCDGSQRFRKARIPGAWWAVRARLAECLKTLDRGKPLVFVSQDGMLARFAAADALALRYDARFLDGGTKAWQAAGLPMEPGTDRFLTETDDVWYGPYDRATGMEAAMREYITWETGLLAQIDDEPGVHFNVT